MARPKKIAPTDLPQTIKDAAWEQIAESGAGALSLRAIARKLGVTAPAIYNYYPSRDDLVTALIVDAFTSLGDAQREALRLLSPEDHAARLDSLGSAYRAWAVAYPQRYQLIFGTPLAKYVAPADTTLPAAAWALKPLIDVLQAIWAAGRLHMPDYAALAPALRGMLQAWQSFEGGSELEVLYLALVIWSRVHGLVMLELGGQLPSFIIDPGEVYRREMEGLRASLLAVA